MGKDDWYENRTLWKAEKHFLFDHKCKKFADLSTELLVNKAY